MRSYAAGFSSFPHGTLGDLYCRPTGVARVIWDGDKLAGNYDFARANAERAEVKLTAVTGGDPGFSAHYVACRSILGLYDDLAGVPSRPETEALLPRYRVVFRHKRMIRGVIFWPRCLQSPGWTKNGRESTNGWRNAGV